MNKFSTIFGQILQILSQGEFYRAVAETEGGVRGGCQSSILQLTDKKR